MEVFSIGFGPELFGWTDRARTRWKISLVPLGGYVKMFGDVNAASLPDSAVAGMSPEDQAVAFPTKRLSQRAWIVAAGPLANFLFAIVLQTVEQVAGTKLDIRSGPRRVGDAPAIFAGTSRIREFLEWRPAHDDLTEIVESAIRLGKVSG